MKKLIAFFLCLVIVLNAFPYVFAYDSNSKFTLLGCASTSEDNIVQLTPLSTWQAGGVWYKDKVESINGLKISFSFWAGGGRNNSYGGADGFVLSLSNTTYNLGNNGEYLGFVRDDAIGVEFDSYSANRNDPNGKHIAIIKNETSNHLCSVLDDRVDDSLWHDVVVTLNIPSISVCVDNNEVLSYDKLESIAPQLYIGIAASTGAGINKHLIRDFEVTNCCDESCTVDGIKIFSSICDNNLCVGDSASYIIGDYIDGALDSESNDFVIVNSDASILSFTPQKWDSNHGRVYCAKALQVGQATITITNPKTGNSAGFTFFVTNSNNVFTFNNIPVIEIEKGKKTNFYNFSGMVINDIVCTSNLAKDKKTIESYSASMTVYNSSPIYGAVTSYSEDGKIYDYCIIDRKETHDSSFVSSVKSLYYEIDDTIYYLQNQYYYSGKSISKETKIDLHIPINGYIEISNNPSISYPVAISNIIHYVYNVLKTGIEAVKLTDVDDKALIVQVVEKLKKRFSFDEALENQYKKGICNLLKSGNFRYGDIDDFLSSFAEEFSVDLFEAIQEEIFSVTGIAKTAESIAKIILPTGTIIKGLYLFNDSLDSLEHIQTYRKSVSYPNGIYIYAPSSNEEYHSNGIIVSPKEYNKNAVIHSYQLYVNENIAFDKNSTFWNDYGEDNYVVTQYDISYYIDNSISQPSSKVEVKIPIPKGYRSADIKIARINKDGSLEDMNAVVQGGYAVFSTEHFSCYMLVSTSSDKISIANINKFNGTTLPYRSSITIHSNTKSPVEWHISGAEYTVNSDGSCSIKQAKKDIQIYCSTTDSNGNEIKSETETIMIRQGFFDKIISFFALIFNNKVYSYLQ